MLKARWRATAGLAAASWSPLPNWHPVFMGNFNSHPVSIHQLFHQAAVCQKGLRLPQTLFDTIAIRYLRSSFVQTTSAAHLALPPSQH